QARTAIAEQNYVQATQLLTKLIGFSAHKYSEEAQELLGVVREKNGQLAHAKAEYKIYLEKYPNGKGAQRVRQRLAAIEASQARPAPRTRSPHPRKVETAAETGKARQPTSPATASTAARTTAVQAAPAEAGDPSAYTTDISGSVSQFYFLNQGTTRLVEFVPRRTTTDDDTYQNSLQTTLNLTGTTENDKRRVELHFTGRHEFDFTDDSENEFRVYEAYVKIESKDSDIVASIGRQRLRGGFLHRFDGIVLSWPATDGAVLNVAAGSPVDHSRDEPFRHDRYFVGASVDFQNILVGTDLSVFAVEQRASSLIDRRSVGAELRFRQDNIWLFGSIDYDLNFGKLNMARVNGTYVFADNSTISARLDYVHSPYLSLTNALQGQSVNSLDALRAAFSVAEIEGLALDRSAETMSANLSYYRQINSKWQMALDGTVFHTSGSPASGGVPATPSPGTEYFLSTQFTGSGIFSERDIVALNARYANAYSSNLYLVGAYTRFPYSENLNLRPRVQVGYRDLKRTSGSEVFVIPSLSANYKLSKTTRLEMEIGGRWTNSNNTASSVERNEIYVIAGYRHEF
ncbi:MAG: tol-pal system YbgF family protein, partial [Paracoccaceae bacterium]